MDDLPTGLSSDEIRCWFAPHPLARTLVTTRSKEHDAIAAAADVDMLGGDEAYELLTARRSPSEKEEKAAPCRIVTQLGCHALAVDVAGAGLRNQEGSSATPTSTSG